MIKNNVENNIEIHYFILCVIIDKTLGIIQGFYLYKKYVKIDIAK